VKIEQKLIKRIENSRSRATDETIAAHFSEKKVQKEKKLQLN
jgi:hypothetical protein